MKKGTKIYFKGNYGISLGAIEKFGVEWILVEYKDGTKALVLESALGVADEDRCFGKV